MCFSWQHGDPLHLDDPLRRDPLPLLYGLLTDAELDGKATSAACSLDRQLQSFVHFPPIFKFGTAIELAQSRTRILKIQVTFLRHSATTVAMCARHSLARSILKRPLIPWIRVRPLGRLICFMASLT